MSIVLKVFIATLGPLQFGYHLAELNAPQSAITKSIPMSNATFATLTSMLVIGALIGALTAGPAASSYGRVSTMKAMTIFFTIGSLIQATAPNVTVFGMGRIIAGIGAGASTVVCPIWVSESVPANRRGFYGMSTQIQINMGILSTQILGYYDLQWRAIMATGAIIGVVSAIGLFFISDVEDEHSERCRLLDEPPSEDTSVLRKSFKEVITNRKYRPALIAVIGIMIAQQFCGINAIMMYSVALLSGVLPVSSGLVTIIISIANLITTLISSSLPDKIGRKACLLASIAGMGTMAFTLATSLSLSIKVLSAMAVILFVMSFAIGLGPVPFLISSELVGPEAVGPVQSIALGSNYIATYIVAQFFPIINATFGTSIAFAIFGGFALLSFLFVAAKVPETKGKKDADQVWGRSPLRVA